MVSKSEFDEEVRAAFYFIAAAAQSRVVDSPNRSVFFGNNFMSLVGDNLNAYGVVRGQK
ncbi:MAG: hypothetical protein ABI120_09035 [Gemmatimonadaceae bacterium]